MKILKHIVWNMPASTNRKGFSRSAHDQKHVIVVETDIFGDVPTIITSDLHAWCGSVFKLLDEYISLEHFLVITAGDMAGPPIFGYDGDPTEEYEFMLEKANEFYFVQGNHDLPGVYNKQNDLKNKCGTFCGLRDGRKINSAVGSIAGVNGIMSNKIHPYKMPEKKYLKYISDLLRNVKNKPRILVTHDTPSLPLTYKDSSNRFVGNEKIFNLIDHHKPHIHIYGHCHHPEFYYYLNEVHFFNADARVIIFKPKATNMDTLVKKELVDLYFSNDKITGLGNLC